MRRTTAIRRKHLPYLKKAFPKQDAVVIGTKRRLGKKSIQRRLLFWRNVGLSCSTPKEAEGDCLDKKCRLFTGSASINGKILKGRVLAAKAWRTISTRRTTCAAPSSPTASRSVTPTWPCIAVTASGNHVAFDGKRIMSREKEATISGEDSEQVIGKLRALTNKAYDARAVDSDAARRIARSLDPERNEYVGFDDYQASEALEFHVMDCDYLTKDLARHRHDLRCGPREEEGLQDPRAR